METLCKIRDIKTAIHRFGIEFEKESNLSLNEGMLLSALMKDNILSSVDLSKKIGLTCSNGAIILKSLEEKDFIIRSISKTDKRIVNFSLTKAGKTKINNVITAMINIPKELKLFLD